MSTPNDKSPDADKNPFAPDIELVVGELVSDDEAGENHEISDEDRRAIIVVAQRHLIRYGSDDWSLVYNQFSDIPHRTVRRWIDKVRHGEVTDEDILVSSIAKARRDAKKIGLHLPAAPSPNVIAAKGADARRSIDFMTHLREMLEDLAMLREWSLKEEEDKEGGKKKGIRNAMYFSMSVKLRKEVIETCVRAMQAIWELGRMEDMYDAIIGVVGQKSPEIQQEIMQAIADLNDRRGFTIAANPRR